MTDASIAVGYSDAIRLTTKLSFPSSSEQSLACRTSFLERHIALLGIVPLTLDDLEQQIFLVAGLNGTTS